VQNGVPPIRIGEHLIGPGQPVFIVAELSGNHGQSFDAAVKLVHLAKNVCRTACYVNVRQLRTDIPRSPGAHREKNGS
jgi:sialic acid synthase SpsE